MGFLLPLTGNDSQLAAPLTGLEPVHLAPEASALSSELQGQVVLTAFFITWRVCFRKRCAVGLWDERS